ncbi:iron complex transport system ATP-binding protein [Vreelandella songnenensis]|uniref:Iron complex transport system ATP-binding protein n=1 Tax=Vreelandella songnenensis TaxID=1176243 RepID=A0A2T0V1L7_9GAMM|nr:ABC transporter ATP-binding protein [Halomonas songnenensis]PRY64054.1 iron complex transport system ATP-binding protein [Halomonas songnenensis]
MGLLAAHQLVIDVPNRPAQPLDLTITPGQVWGVLGPNGAGKTTLLHTLAGLRAPRSGSVTLDDTPLASLGRRQVAQRLGLVFQERMESFPATVLETALIGRHPFLSAWQQEGRADYTRAQHALECLDIAHLRDRLMSTLSGGERQRVALATLLTQDPAIWLADEPTNHLDLHHQSAVMALMAEQAGKGKSVVMCLHDLNLAARWCDHVLLLYPNGEARVGERDALLITEILEPLFQQRLAMGDIDGNRVFMPRG